MARAPRLFVISGCSGGGKSTLLAQMAARGWAVAHEPVFLAPPWPELRRPDAERRLDLAAAVAEHDHLETRYPAEGYRTEPLPRLSVAERADWLEARLDALEAAA